MSEEEPVKSEPRARRKRAWGTLSSNAIDADKPRPLTPLAATLLARRRTRLAGSDSPDHGADGAEPPDHFSTQDGKVSYALSTVDAGLLVHRTVCRQVQLQLVQTFHFTDAGVFDRWCKADSLRFEEPLLWEQLRRRGHELLDGRR